MNNLLHLMMTGLVEDSTPLTDLLDLSFERSGTGGAAIASTSINPTVGALVPVLVMNRISSATSIGHTMPTTTITGMRDFGAGDRFTFICEREELGAAGVKASAWYGIRDSGTDPGVITGNLDASVDARAIQALAVAEGWHQTTPIRVASIDAARANSGSTLVLNPPVAPLATSLCIAFGVANTNDATATPPTDFSMIQAATAANTLHAFAAKKFLNTPAGAVSFTTLATAIRAGGFFEVLQQP